MKRQALQTVNTDLDYGVKLKEQGENSLSENVELKDAGPLVPCQDCGRKFVAGSLARHRKICRKVFRQKRNIFDSTRIRLNAIEENNNATVAQLRKPNRGLPPNPETKTSWRAKSAQFRAAIGSVRNDQFQDGTSLKDIGLVRCPHCGRSFNEDASRRHIPVCLKIFPSQTAGRLTKGDGQLSHSRRAELSRPLLKRQPPVIGSK